MYEKLSILLSREATHTKVSISWIKKSRNKYLDGLQKASMNHILGTKYDLIEIFENRSCSKIVLNSSRHVNANQNV